MKKIVLIGDSIRMGYDKYIKQALDGVATVYYPAENCQYAENVLRFAKDWKQKGEWGDDVDLVHWNAGLWDTLLSFDDMPLTSPAYYSETIGRINKLLKILFPNAIIIFATSTRVLEEKMSPKPWRHNSTIEKYNRIAIDALSDSDTIINDLYSITSSCPIEYYSDAVHLYTDEGRALVGGKVLSVICKELGISAKDVNLENFEPEKYSKTNIGY